MANLHKYQFGNSNYTQWGISNYEQWFGELLPLITVIAGYYVLEPVNFYNMIESMNYYNKLEAKYNA